jgi:hypothetical protein
LSHCDCGLESHFLSWIRKHTPLKIFIVQTWQTAVDNLILLCFIVRLLGVWREEKWDKRVWTWFIWFRTGTIEGFCDHGNKTFNCIKCWGTLKFWRRLLLHGDRFGPAWHWDVIYINTVFSPETELSKIIQCADIMHISFHRSCWFWF